MADDWQDLPADNEDNTADDWQDVNDWQDSAPVPEPSQLESFGHGARQGASFGLADEVGGALGALGVGDQETQQGIGDLARAQERTKSEAAQRLKDPKAITDDMMSQGFSEKAINDQLAWLGDQAQKEGEHELAMRYRVYRDRQRIQDEASSKANPNSYFLGSLAGGAAAPIGSGASLGRLAGQGALAGFGGSEADNAEDLAKDTGKGLILGGGLGLAGKLASAGLSKAAPTIKNSAYEILTTPRDPSTLVGKGYQGLRKVETASGALADSAQQGVSKILDKVGISPDSMLGKNLPKAGEVASYFTPIVGKGIAANRATNLGLKTGLDAVKRKASTLSQDNVEQIASRIDQRYGRTLREAANRGGHSLAVTNYLLGESDPDYREQVRRAEEENEQGSSSGL